MQKTPEQMIQELYTVTLGVPNTSDKGMAQDLKDIEKHLRELNGSVKTNTTWRKALCRVMGAMVTGFGTLYILSVV